MTYSVLAVDGRAGQIGVATQSHFFGAARLVLWARHGVGVVATQSFANASYGPLGLDGLAGGRDPDRVLSDLTRMDEQAPIRQVAILDVIGRGAAVTGEACIRYASSAIAEGVVAVGNMLRCQDTADLMLAAYTRSSGELASRLLSALEAGQRSGGDLRGMQSAGVMVVRTSALNGPPPHPPVVDLRIEDHEDPLRELRRLLMAGQAAEALAEVLFDVDLLHGPIETLPVQRIDATADALDWAQSLVPDNLEPTFWKSVILGRAGRLSEARSALNRAVAANADWAEFFDRVAMTGRLPVEIRGLLDKPS